MVYIFKEESDYRQLIVQPNPDSDSVDKAGSLVIPAELAYWEDDPIHLPQFHTVHQAVEPIEVLLYGLVGYIPVEELIKAEQA